MAVTIQKIAELSGVSRGTVDRVLHGRPNVNPMIREKVVRAAEKLGYSLQCRRNRQIAGKRLFSFRNGRMGTSTDRSSAAFARHCAISPIQRLY